MTATREESREICRVLSACNEDQMCPWNKNVPTGTTRNVYCTVQSAYVSTESVTEQFDRRGGRGRNVSYYARSILPIGTPDHRTHSNLRRARANSRHVHEFVDVSFPQIGKR